MVDERLLSDLNGAFDDPVRWAFLAGVHMLSAGRASLLLRRDNDRVLIPAAAVGISPSVLSSIRVPFGEGIAGRVAERGVLLMGMREDQSFLCAPILTDRGVDGVINLTDRTDDRQFEDVDVAVVTALAKHVGYLLQIGRLGGESTSGTARQSFRERTTGLPNRRLFDDMLERELARSKRAGTPFAVALVELQAFRAMSEQLGPAGGQSVMRDVGSALQHALRRYDFVSLRRGGEFGLLLAAPNEAEEWFVQRIEGAVGEAATRLGLEISVRIGIAACPVDGTTAGDLIAQASTRLSGDSGMTRVSP